MRKVIETMEFILSDIFPIDGMGRREHLVRDWLLG